MATSPEDLSALTEVLSAVYALLMCVGHTKAREHNREEQRGGSTVSRTGYVATSESEWCFSSETLTGGKSARPIAQSMTGYSFPSAIQGRKFAY